TDGAPRSNPVKNRRTSSCRSPTRPPRRPRSRRVRSDAAPPAWKEVRHDPQAAGSEGSADPAELGAVAARRAHQLRGSGRGGEGPAAAEAEAGPGGARGEAALP